MTFIHKNVNSALLMLITFISVALVTATVYSVQAFDSVANDAMEKEQQLRAITAELADAKAKAESFQAAQLTAQEREKALAEIMQKQREETAQPEQKPSAGATSQPIANSASGGPVFNSGSLAASGYPVQKAPYNPYRQKYWGWVPSKLYVI